MKIAVASSDGQKVDCHFGKADKFFIYQIEDGMVLSEGPRHVVAYSTSPSVHVFEESRLQPLLQMLEDCSAVYVTRIGETPRRKLEDAGLQVHLSESFVHQLLSQTTGENP